MFTKISKLFQILTTPERFQKAWYSFKKSTPLHLKIKYDIFDYANYAYGCYHSALQAKTLGFDSITFIEFGVAGGNGLIALENISAAIEKEMGLNIEILGFDGNSGLPDPIDYRDLPYYWKKGHYQMDQEALEKKLTSSSLLLGNIEENIKILERKTPPPIAFISFDLDYYSSTDSAFHIFDLPSQQFLPRTFCYFDDTIGDDFFGGCEYVGEGLAINEFNQKNKTRKIAQIHGLSHKRTLPAQWNEAMYLLHDFQHPHYNTYLGHSHSTQLPLK